jgi:hypothetical protein
MVVLALYSWAVVDVNISAAGVAMASCVPDFMVQ